MASGTAPIFANTEFASPAAIAALRAQPGFAEAMRFCFAKNFMSSKHAHHLLMANVV